MKILDATCGARHMWYQKNHPFVTYLDKRKGKYDFIYSGNGGIRKTRVNIDPDIQADWTKELPFENGHFDMIVFDPPHIIRKKENKQSFLEHQYGSFMAQDYKNHLQRGITELFRVLREEGVFILKWCDLNRPVEEILRLFPYPPMFGTRAGQRNNVHWIVFIKYQQNGDLFQFEDDIRSNYDEVID